MHVSKLNLFIIVTSNYAAFRLNAKIITAKETNKTLSVVVSLASISIPGYNYNDVAMCELGMGRRRRKIRLIESNAKCHYLKKFTCKGTLRQVFYLSEAPPLLCPQTPPPLHTACVYTVQGCESRRQTISSLSIPRFR